jgi:hypothetical protein
LISATDAVFLFVLLALSLVASTVLAIKIWHGSKKRKRLTRELAASTDPGNVVAS